MGLDYLLIPNSPNLDFGSGDFTIEFWIYPSTTPAQFDGILSKRATTAVYSPLQIQFGASNTIQVLSSAGASWNVNMTSSDTCADGQWSHVAVTRNGSTWTTYIDGVAQTPATSSHTVMSNTTQVAIGASAADGSNPIEASFIDDLRITKGVARYTTTFTPPDAPFPDL